MYRATKIVLATLIAIVGAYRVHAVCLTECDEMDCAIIEWIYPNGFHTLICVEMRSFQSDFDKRIVRTPDQRLGWCSECSYCFKKVWDSIHCTPLCIGTHPSTKADCFPEGEHTDWAWVGACSELDRDD